MEKESPHGRKRRCSATLYCRSVIAVPVLAAAGLIAACAAGPHEPTLDELAHNPGFQQCLLDSGIEPDQLTQCMAGNPDDESARACLQAHLGEKYAGPASSALYRCYHLPAQMQAAASPPPGRLNCYRGLMGVTCR